MFLFLGDNVYGDVTSGAMTELQQAYARLGRNPDFQALRRETEVLATWDDHDYDPIDVDWDARTLTLSLRGLDGEALGAG